MKNIHWFNLFSVTLMGRSLLRRTATPLSALVLASYATVGLSHPVQASTTFGPWSGTVKLANTSGNLLPAGDINATFTIGPDGYNAIVDWTVNYTAVREIIRDDGTICIQTGHIDDRGTLAGAVEVTYVPDQGRYAIQVWGPGGTVLVATAVGTITYSCISRVDPVSVTFYLAPVAVRLYPPLTDPGLSGDILTSIKFADGPDLGDAYTMTVDLTRTGPPTPIYVAVGDSYSSGEGARSFQDGVPGGTYITGTDILGVDECHRSTSAYPYKTTKLTSLPLLFFACSGAQIDNFYFALSGGGWNEGAQLDRVRQAQTPSTDVRDITVTIGGNDANFPDILKACVTAHASDLFGLTGGKGCRHDSSLFLSDSALLALQNRLAALYRDLHLAAPNAKVLVLGYPRLFATKANQDNCDLYAKDAEYLNFQLTRLNTAIKSAVDGANRSIAGSVTYIRYIDTLNAFAGHELCRPASDGAPSYLHGWIPTQVFLDGHVESFHPNILGMAALGAVVDANLP